MQPSELEIRREVEALRDIRRRSTAGGPGSLILDPDLPSASTQTSPTSPYWSPDDLSSSSNGDTSDTGSEESNSDPFHLFWVPARLHPEIAPAEFRQFLKEHARSPSDESPSLGRSVSSGSTGLGRKRSMLSRQYRPSPNDGVEDEEVLPIRRNRSSIYNTGPQLTISDLQKLEELADEASKSDDPTKLRSVLRRSLSLNVAPSVIDQMDDLNDPGDDADSPIIVPRMGEGLRRAARTKIRKPGMQGEGAHRFTATRSRRKSVGRSATVGSPRTSSEMSVSDHGHAEASRMPRAEDISPTPQAPSIPPVPPLPRPESYSEEALIYDAYVTEEPDDIDAPHRETTPEPSVESSASGPSSTTTHPESHEAAVESGPVLQHPRPQRAVAPPVTEPPVEAHTPSPPPTTAAASPPSNVLQPRPSVQETPVYHPPSPSPSEQRRDKDKKGGLFKWGSDKSSKKQKEKEKESREREKDKDTGFFGSLFGGKKKQEDAPPSMANQSGREAAAALLGASKSSKNYVPSPSPQLAGMYARYPIHVERAIYRLSHIKLANPRRPLYEQVLISNLMFWYLGVINKTQNPQNAGANGAAQPQPQVPGQAQPVPDKEQQEREQREREERDRAEQERLEREQEQREKQRRGSLTKPGAANAPQPGVRRAEMPVRGPQYEMQHRAMEHEYGHGYSNSMSGPGGSAYGFGSAGGGSYQATPAPRSSSAPPQPYTVGLVQPQPQPANGSFYNMGNVSMQSQQYTSVVVGGQLPPGAMPPIAVEQTWLANQGSSNVLSTRGNTSPSPPRSVSPPSPPNQSVAPRRTRSPPPNRYTSAQEKQPAYSAPGARLPSRSLSASAAPPVVSTMHHLNNAKLKKGISAHAVVQNSRRRPSEDEDVPLALWQQTRRK
ncbi:hypothetical protein DAEQUDRAFT_606830 [Daedalea quercina L-15889]|uniref:Protein Zds1 C-terminal domain-containing protein n=1 Tax=Daedalea quercina L-15889 TaxID=1314783 RepID=A0A165LJ54_9APHY|nr:hypothetical protein DAEQUDRAFT_606830 [Daedalea quercina L-15889]